MPKRSKCEEMTENEMSQDSGMSIAVADVLYRIDSAMRRSNEGSGIIWCFWKES